jgi:LDH2 family malate/lactate/ureidoglycolate dehydrogenase
VPPFPAYLPVPEDPVGEGIGHFFGAMRIDAFRPAVEFKTHMDKWIQRFREAKPAEGQEKVWIPGDPEIEMKKKREIEGIPLLEPVIKDLEQLAQKFDIEFP